ncbi:hypothetical protein HPB49_012017 [Dermacentor silvarum]|uniref:Uncharacterized protein n=1 Tax=Dermacentor silvarum TaxID=543639 RepID=A0ACB8DPA5_DERSI|nr:hypothetical protein HPB49_012017 [Dermacentor silvarum]
MLPRHTTERPEGNLRRATAKRDLGSVSTTPRRPPARRKESGDALVAAISLFRSWQRIRTMGRGGAPPLGSLRLRSQSPRGEPGRDSVVAAAALADADVAFGRACVATTFGCTSCPPDFSAQDWLHNFHLSRATFEHACDLLRDHIATHDTAWRPATPVEKKVAVFLWRLSNNCHYKVLSQLFGVGRSSACLILKEAIQALILHVMPRVIKPCENTPSFFEEVYGLPGCHGVICSTYISVSPPNYVKAEYAVPGQADLYACLLQVVVGRDGQITAARAGQTPSRPGRLEDWAFVPELTALEQDAPSSSAESRTPGPFAYLVADSSFPLRPEVLKPYDFAATEAAEDVQQRP